MIVAVLLLALIASVNGHMWLRNPVSRGGIDSIGGTSAPCSGLNTGGTVTTYEVGQQVNFQFRVNQHGPNPFDFKLLDANNQPITLTATTGTLPTGIPNTVTAGPDGFNGVNVPVTIPNYPCQNCAIQLSGMGQPGGSGTWYQCASVKIVPAGTLNQPQPSSVSPATGATSGGGVVTVTGIGFGATAQTIYCKIGDNVVTGTYVSATQVTCPVPPNNNPDTSTIEVSSDGTTFSATGTIFTYTGAVIVPVVSSIEPSNADPGQNVTIHGQYFYSHAMQCKFNGTISKATVVSDTMAVCAVPMNLHPADISVTVTVDNSPPSTAVNFRVNGIALAMPVGTIAGIVVGVFFFGALIGVFAFLMVTKKISFGSLTTPSGWQRSVA
jgi:hypothetical protein